ncbi:MAG: tetratricopeptide repeat protein [Terracidiphilus sp.]
MQSRFANMGKLIAMLAEWLLLACIAPSLPGQALPEQLAEHQKLAQRAEANEDFETAIREYQLLAHWLPQSSEVQSNLGVALYFHHDLAKAADVFRRAIALNQSLYTPHLFLGLAMVRLSQPDAAAAELQKAIVINSNDPLAHIWLGYAYIAQSRYEDAVSQLETAAQEQPANSDIAFALGQCYLDLGKAAIAQLSEVAPDGGRTWQLAAEQFEAQGNLGKALRAYQGAVQRRPDIEVVRARILALGGSLPEPGKEVADDTGPEDAVYSRVQQYQQKAREAFERVSQIDADSYRAHQVQADSFVAADRFDDAIQEYRIVLQRNPDLPGIHGAICNAMARMGQFQEAVKECDAEIVLAPFSAEAYVDSARVRLLAHDDAQAAILLEKALKLDRPPVAVYKLLGKLYLSQKQYQAATKALRKYLSVESKDSSAYYLLSRACKYSGDTEGMNQAIAAFKKTSEAAKNTAEAHDPFDNLGSEDEASGQGGRKEDKEL